MLDVGAHSALSGPHRGRANARTCNSALSRSPPYVQGRARARRIEVVATRPGQVHGPDAYHTVAIRPHRFCQPPQLCWLSKPGRRAIEGAGGERTDEQAMQVIKHAHPSLPPRPGHVEQCVFVYVRHGVPDRYLRRAHRPGGRAQPHSHAYGGGLFDSIRWKLRY
jgi:hypothetical protein